MTCESCGKYTVRTKTCIRCQSKKYAKSPKGRASQKRSRERKRHTNLLNDKQLNK